MRSYLSSSFNLEIDTGPNISSGVLKRDIRYSKAVLWSKASFKRLAIRLLATPGGPRKKILSPEIAESSDNAFFFENSLVHGMQQLGDICFDSFHVISEFCANLRDFSAKIRHSCIFVYQ